MQKLDRNERLMVFQMKNPKGKTYENQLRFEIRALHIVRLPAPSLLTIFVTTIALGGKV